MALTDCISKDPAVCELFVVQPREAFVRIKSERDRFTQAVLAVDSEIVDSEGADLFEVLDDEQFQMLIAALGVGIDIRESETYGLTHFQIDRLRYDKIVLVMDGTAEGMQTKNRLLSLIRRFLSPLIAAHHVFMVSVDSLERAVEVENRSLIPVT